MHQPCSIYIDLCRSAQVQWCSGVKHHWCFLDVVVMSSKRERAKADPLIATSDLETACEAFFGKMGRRSFDEIDKAFKAAGASWKTAPVALL